MLICLQKACFSLLVLACPNKTNVQPAQAGLLYRYVYAVYHVDGLVQERRNFSALAMELHVRLSCRLTHQNMLSFIGICFKGNILNKSDICVYSFWDKLHHVTASAGGINSACLILFLVFFTEKPLYCCLSWHAPTRPMSIQLTQNYVLYRYVCAVYHVNMLGFVEFCFNTLRPGQNGHHFPGDIFKCILLKENN